IKGNDHRARNFSRFAQSGNHRMFPAPGAAGFHFQVKHHIVFFGELQDFFKKNDVVFYLEMKPSGTSFFLENCRISSSVGMRSPANSLPNQEPASSCRSS